MSSDDFDPKKEIQDITAILYQPDKFSELFCKAAGSQKNIDEILRTIIRDLIQKDHTTIEFIKDLIKECERKDLMIMIKKGFSLIGTVIIAIVSGLIGHWLK
jgi:ferritin